MNRIVLSTFVCTVVFPAFRLKTKTQKYVLVLGGEIRRKIQKHDKIQKSKNIRKTSKRVV